jgi:hypothetical protein
VLEAGKFQIKALADSIHERPGFASDGSLNAMSSQVRRDGRQKGKRGPSYFSPELFLLLFFLSFFVSISHKLGKCSTSESHPQPFLAFI